MRSLASARRDPGEDGSDPGEDGSGGPVPADEPLTGPREAHGRRLDDIEPEQCWVLLRSRSLGRLVYTESALPAVVPLSYAVVARDVVVAADAGLPVVAAARGSVVAFQVDDVDPVARTGWSVTAVGPARLLGDPHLAIRLREGGLAPWAPSQMTTYMAISVCVLSGRHLPGG